jgi:hypothetical protein
MRFKLGVAVGVAAGYWAASRSNEERRRQLEEAVQRIKENPRVQHVTETVSRDARRIGDAVESRLVSSADVAADTIAGTVEDDSGSRSSTSGASSSTGSKAKSQAS